MRRFSDNRPVRIGIVRVVLVASFVSTGGCGEAELSRPKPRQFEPNKQAASPRPPSGSASRPAPARRPRQSAAEKSRQQIEHAARIIHSPEVSEETAARAVDRLAYHKDAALPELRKLLDDPRPKVRIKAVLAVGRVGERSDGDRLARLLRTDPLLGVRSWAAHGLGRLRAEQHMGALIDGLMDPEVRVRQMSYKAIGELTGFSYAFDPEAAADRREKQAAKFRENINFLKSLAVKRTAQRERQKAPNRN
ncbi:MAG: HEAT repeat domain-containing protein [Phycisphaeraceae bacterium]|nr:HEAT repeat domain-containing protein [Phycisphaeraceae bacterium]